MLYNCDLDVGHLWYLWKSDGYESVCCSWFEALDVAKTKDHCESKLNAKGEILDVYYGCLVSYIVIPLSRQLIRNIQFLFILSSLANF